ncbi:ribonuclease H-like domain-containing protein [Tanacetum coccineum]
MHDPRDPHFAALKHILRYVRGTVDHGLQLHVSSTAQLTAYSDNDWAGCPFAMTDLGSLNYFLGVSAQRTASGMFLSQSKFTVEILDRANMQKCNSCKTPVDNVRVLHVPSRYQYADIFTKGLPSALFLEFRSSLNIRRSPVHTEEEY